ncbi:MAG: hypothetical protein KME45_29900 [Stenomitos rutilans HA7619-LM2]|jgi:hypothetical protein|nr:hypothetical protein [Stenomitos rutilans HA7619-LM2]
MTKPPLQWCKAAAPQQFFHLPFSLAAGASILLTAIWLATWMPAANARPFIRVQNNSSPNAGSVINFPPVVPFGGSIYNPVQTIVQPGYGSGLSVQIGTPSNYPSSGYSSQYIYRQPGNVQYRGNVNNSVLINPTVINSPIRNSTLVNPTIVTAPYAPYYNTQTVTTTTRPEPEVYIDPQYGVRYRSPSATSVQPIIVYPQIIYPQSNP